MMDNMEVQVRSGFISWFTDAEKWLYYYIPHADREQRLKHSQPSMFSQIIKGAKVWNSCMIGEQKVPCYSLLPLRWI